MLFAIISKIKALIVYLGVDTIYSCPLLGLSMCTKYAEKNLKLKKICLRRGSGVDLLRGTKTFLLPV